MRLLITGAAGFIGTHLTAELEAHGHDVVGIDRPELDLLDPLARTKLADMIRDAGVDRVVHLAAKVGRLFGEDDVTRTIMDNVGITATVALACADAGVPLAYASTSEVYGDLGHRVATESDPLVSTILPHNTYGLSKRQGEEYSTLYAPDGLILFRFSMPYGPGHPPGRGRAALTNVLHQALHRQPIPIHIGAERSWCYIEDTVCAVRLVLEASASEPERFSGPWNVGRDDNALPMRTVAEMACDMVGAPHDLIQDVPAPGRQTVVKRLSTNRLRRDVRWSPRVELDEGMRRVLDYVRTFDADGSPVVWNASAP